MTLYAVRRHLSAVPALTVFNPWPVAIYDQGPNAKRIENRSWAPSPKHKQIFIHAGKAWDERATPLLVAAGIDPTLAVPSSIGALVTLGPICKLSRYTHGMMCGCGFWAFPGQCHWALAEVLVLPHPVPCGGRLGLWHPPASVLDAIAEQLAALDRSPA